MIKKIVVFFCLTLIILASSWALLQPSFFRAHDYVHSARVIEMARALQDGHIIPRWSQNFGYGYGMPLFEFYAPFPYVLGAVLFMFGLSMMTTLKLLFLFTNVGTAIGAYQLGKSIFGRLGGLLTAALLTLAPYRALNLFVRGALSEAWGILFLPWILLGLYKIFHRQKHGRLITIFATTGLLLSHNLTSMIFLTSIVIFILLLSSNYLLVSAKNTQQKFKDVTASLSQILLSMLLGLGLSSFYVIPAILEKNYTKVNEAVTGGYFNYELHFLYLRQFAQSNWGYGGSSWGPNDELSFFLGWPQLIGSTLVGLAIVFRFIAKREALTSFIKEKKLFLTLGFFILSIINLLMTTPKSLFLWHLIPSLEYIQFPWRWLSGVTIWLALFASFLVFYIKNKLMRSLVVFGFIVLSLFTNAHYFRPEAYLDDFESLYYTDKAKISSNMSGILYDYMPKDVPLTIVPPKYSVDCSPIAAFSTPCIGVESVIERVHEKLYRISLANETKLTFAVADFPGWLVEIDGNTVEHAKNSQGLIEVVVPEGSNTVGLFFGQTTVRKVADLISFISLLGVMICINTDYSLIKKSKKS